MEQKTRIEELRGQLETQMLSKLIEESDKTAMELMYEVNEHLIEQLKKAKTAFEQINKLDPHEEHENTIEMIDGAIFYQEELKETTKTK